MQMQRLQILVYDEIDFYDLSNIDLIISTISLPDITIPVIEVSPILTKGGN